MCKMGKRLFVGWKKGIVKYTFIFFDGAMRLVVIFLVINNEYVRFVIDF